MSLREHILGAWEDWRFVGSADRKPENQEMIHLLRLLFRDPDSLYKAARNITAETLTTTAIEEIAEAVAQTLKRDSLRTRIPTEVQSTIEREAEYRSEDWGFPVSAEEVMLDALAAYSGPEHHDIEGSIRRYLELTAKEYNALESAGVVSIVQLERMSEEELLNIWKLGKKGVSNIQREMKKLQTWIGKNRERRSPSSKYYLRTHSRYAWDSAPFALY